jgi:hypothetical protein
MTVEFDVPRYLGADDTETLIAVNESLARLRDRRVKQLDAAGYGSKLAWKLRVFEEVKLYRVVALTESLALNWNHGNMLGCYLPARALIETIAIILDLEHELVRLVPEKDVPAIDQVLMNRTFATRLTDWITNDPSTHAVNVLTLIDRLDKRLIRGVRDHYDRMSERCHPNYLGSHAMFSELDTSTGITTFRLDKHRYENMDMVMAPMMLVMLFESCLVRLDAVVEQIAALQGGKK